MMHDMMEGMGLSMSLGRVIGIVLAVLMIAALAKYVFFR